MTDFRRPIPNRQNELLRKNLAAPAYDLDSLADKSERGSSLAKEPSTLETNEFPIKGLAPDNKPPGLQKSKVNRANVTRRDDDTTKDITAPTKPRPCTTTTSLLLFLYKKFFKFIMIYFCDLT